MRGVLEFGSDTAFYYAVGVFTIVIFAIGLAILATTNPEGVGRRELVGFVGGFTVFMFVYFVSVTVHRLEEGEEF